MNLINNNLNAKPFLKWAGGKTQLIPHIADNLPKELIDNELDTYIEPFLGGGAVLIYLLKNYSVKNVMANDINTDLVTAYRVIQNDVESLILFLEELQNEYLSLNEENRKTYFYTKRDSYNRLKNKHSSENQNDLQTDILKSSYLIFLNKTCFNGLYRLNSKGQFNVPHGRYKNPLICDAENLRNLAVLFKDVKFLNTSYQNLQSEFDKGRTFMYIDPPYRALPNTPSFVSYFNSSFGESEQLDLANWCTALANMNIKLLISNSDPKNTDPQDNFFEDNYPPDIFTIKRIKALRNINSKGSGRGQISELLIKNY